MQYAINDDKKICINGRYHKNDPAKKIPLPFNLRCDHGAAIAQSLAERAADEARGMPKYNKDHAANNGRGLLFEVCADGDAKEAAHFARLH